MLKGAKRRTLRALNGLGLSRRLSGSPWRRDRLLILCYHGISLVDEHEWDSSLYMRASTFEGRLRAIERSGCAVLPLGVALERLYANALEQPTVAITFDDGLYDFGHRAYPLLEKYGFPATVYLTTYYCEHQQPVFPAFCSYVLWKGRAGILDTTGMLDVTERWDLRTDGGRAGALESIIRFSQRQHLTAAAKTRLAQLVARRIGVDYDSLVTSRVLHLLNSQEVADLAARGVDFQLHTHRHYAPPSRTLLLREIHDNRERIRNMTGSDPVHFCYPCGYYEREWLPWLADAGVRSATTGSAGLASSRTHPLLLPRLVDTGHLATVEFEAWLGGVASFLPRRRQRHTARPLSEELRVESALNAGAPTDRPPSPSSGPMLSRRS